MKELNYLLFRVVMGVNMTLHGAVRIFGDYQGFITKMETMFADSILPGFLVTMTAHMISPMEFIFGLMLLVGFKTQLAVIVLTFNMLVLVSGVCLIQKWNLAGMQMSYVLYLFFVGHFVEYNKYSLDHFLKRRS